MYPVEKTRMDNDIEMKVFDGKVLNLIALKKDERTFYEIGIQDFFL